MDRQNSLTAYLIDQICSNQSKESTITQIICDAIQLVSNASIPRKLNDNNALASLQLIDMYPIALKLEILLKFCQCNCDLVRKDIDVS